MLLAFREIPFLLFQQCWMLSYIQTSCKNTQSILDFFFKKETIEIHLQNCMLLPLQLFSCIPLPRCTSIHSKVPVWGNWILTPFHSDRSYSDNTILRGFPWWLSRSFPSPQLFFAVLYFVTIITFKIRSTYGWLAACSLARTEAQHSHWLGCHQWNTSEFKTSALHRSGTNVWLLSK